MTMQNRRVCDHCGNDIADDSQHKITFEAESWHSCVLIFVGTKEEAVAKVGRSLDFCCLGCLTAFLAGKLEIPLKEEVVDDKCPYCEHPVNLHFDSGCASILSGIKCCGCTASFPNLKIDAPEKEVERLRTAIMRYWINADTKKLQEIGSEIWRKAVSE